jgi:23S rRNA (adenine-N6)-dimethyltransferase
MSPIDPQHSRASVERTANHERGIWVVKEAGVTDTDLVVEFGAGAGMLTRALSKNARKVVAVEYDPFWAARLKQSFEADENVEVIAADALRVSLPEDSLRVVANVPFHITTAILHRLLDDPMQPPELLHLLVQKELARKHARAFPTTLKTLTWSPWYRFEAAFELSASAFYPKPKVGICLLAVAKRDTLLITPDHRELFRAFVREAFVREAFNGRGNVVGKVLRPVFTKRQIRRLARDNGFSPDSFPSWLSVHQWTSAFEFMVQAVP